MGTWLNVAFVATEDVEHVQSTLRELVEARGRKLVAAKRRKPKPYDPMQYGDGDEVTRWALAAFRGAPGWTVVRTAPFELLLQHDNALLRELARATRAAAFQYNVYDGDSHYLVEVAPDGAIERSGFNASRPAKHWPNMPPDDRAQVRFRIIDVEPAARALEAENPDARVVGLVPNYRRPDHKHVPDEQRAELEHMWRDLEERSAARRDALLAWLASAGGSTDAARGQFQLWRAHPAHVVRALRGDGDSFLSIEGVCDAAIRACFGGPNKEHCDNLLLVQTLVPHAPLPVDGFVLYADRDVDRKAATTPPRPRARAKANRASRQGRHRRRSRRCARPSAHRSRAGQDQAR